MHSLNEQSKKIMEALITQLEDGYFKLDNFPGTFMPLIVEKIADEQCFTAVYSLAHYGEQNGDLMADPEMTFGESEQEFYPLSFRNDYAGVHQDVFAEKVNIKLQHELVEFANKWLHEIMCQQKLNIQQGD